eukprot:gene4351-6155_t
MRKLKKIVLWLILFLVLIIQNYQCIKNKKETDVFNPIQIFNSINIQKNYLKVIKSFAFPTIKCAEKITSPYKSTRKLIEPSIIENNRNSLSHIFLTDITNDPSLEPSFYPSIEPSSEPSLISDDVKYLTPTYEPSIKVETFQSYNPTHDSQDNNILSTHYPTFEQTDIGFILTTTPSFQPTLNPTMYPTIIPTYTPLLEPSNSPTFSRIESTVEPTMNPTIIPSLIISVDPILSPTIAPTYEPTYDSTLLPTEKTSISSTYEPTLALNLSSTELPTHHPLLYPTIEPSFEPSHSPTFSPTIEPTVELTMNPSLMPSLATSVDPTLSLTTAPTYEPTVDSILAPTLSSTEFPNVTPTIVPSLEPSHSPTIPPTIASTDEPTMSPSLMPSLATSVDPTLSPTIAPTRKPIVDSTLPPTEKPSLSSTYEPTVPPKTISTSCPSYVPSSRPTFVQTNIASLISSIVPTLSPTSEPTIDPTEAPSIRNTLSPSVIASTSPTTLPVAPSILSISPAVSSICKDEQTSLCVAVKLSTNGFVYCQALNPKLLQTSQLINNPSSLLINLMSPGYRAQTSNNSAIITLDNLSPSTEYHVYCSTKSFSGAITNAAVITETVSVQRTACCKVAEVSFSVRNMLTSTSAVDAITINLNTLPTSVVTVSLLSTNLNFYPSLFFFGNNTMLTTARATIVSSDISGSFQVSVNIDGSSMNEYTTSFVGNNIITVLDSNTKTPPPNLQSCILANDGSSVVLTLDSPSDKANIITSTFTCSSILFFIDSDLTMCQWQGYSSIIIYLGSGGYKPEVGSNISVLGNKLKAKCTSSSCSTWSYMTESSIAIQAPFNPVKPTVVLQSSGVISACSNMTLDFSSSYGSGGRNWKSIIFSFHRNENLDQRLSNISSTQVLNGYIESSLTITNSDLVVGSVYSISLQLCNFMGACGQRSFTVQISMINSTIPTGGIVGQTYRSMFTTDTLVINSFVYTLDCNGNKQSNNLLYDWVVMSDTYQPLNLVSETQDSSKFKLSPYKLTPSSQYRIRLTVTSTISMKSSTYSVIVLVGRSPLIAQIRGGSQTSVIIGQEFSLDATTSYDPDVSTSSLQNSGLSFEWTCVQLVPFYSLTCLMDSISEKNSAILNLFVGSSADNSTSRFTVTVFDSTRQSQSYIDITVVPASSSIVNIITPTSSVSNLNVNSNILLTGQVQTFSSKCDAVWKITDDSISLMAISLSPYIIPIDVGSIRTTNLLLSTYSLPVRSSLLFTLSCGESMASILISTNGAPLPGTFVVSPATGVELQTSFRLSALLWVDTELPLMYQFVFLSSSANLPLLIQGKSELTYTTTALSKGPENVDYAVTCLVNIFDAIGAYTNSTATVHVRPSEADLDGIVTNHLSTVATSNHVLRNSIAVISSVTNNANCSLVSSDYCSSLNREDCQLIDHTCGGCLTGFIGTSGDHNSACISSNLVSNTNNGSEISNMSCENDYECEAGEICYNGLCKIPENNCSPACDLHGQCLIYNVNNCEEQASCLVNDPTCKSMCVCDDGYSGESCTQSFDDSSNGEAIRSLLISRLKQLTESDDVTDQSVSYWTNNLKSILENRYEISRDILNDVNDLISTILHSTTSYNSISFLLDVLDTLRAISTSCEYKVSDHRRLFYNATSNFSNPTNIINAIDAYAEMVVESMVIDEKQFTSTHESFKIISRVQSNEEVVVQAPRTNLEMIQQSNVPSITAQLEGGAELVLFTTLSSDYVQTNIALNNSVMISNPIHVKINPISDTLSHGSFFMIVKLPHIVPASNYSNVTFNSTCTSSTDFSQHYYVCPGSNYVIHHNCSGKHVYYKSYCPVFKPTCSLINVTTGNPIKDNLNVCYFLTYSSDYTVCNCSIPIATNSTDISLFGRQLAGVSGGNTNPLFSIAAFGTYIASDFKDTFSEANNLDSLASVKKVLTIIILFAVEWGVGFAIVIGFAGRYKMTIKTRKVSTVDINHGHGHACDGNSSVDIGQYLVEYISVVFPAVYYTHKASRLGQILHEILIHHRYFTLLSSPKGEFGDHAKIITGIKLLTVQTMLMFLLALLYDLQAPTDDGSCSSHSKQVSCYQRKYPFDHKQTYCQWTSNDSGSQCIYQEHHFSFTAIMYMTVLVSLLTVFLLKPIDYAFEYLSARSSDAVGVGSVDYNNNNNNNKIKESTSLNGNIDHTWNQAMILDYYNVDKSYDILSNSDLSKRLVLARSVLDNNHLKGEVRYQSSSLDITALENPSHNTSQIKELYEQLKYDIYYQRKCISKLDLREFDEQWGLNNNKNSNYNNNNNNFLKQVATNISFDQTDETSEHIINPLHIQKEIELVFDFVNKKKSEIKYMSDKKKGLELFKLFILDLLGRNTPAAIIFQTKFEQDFIFSKTVTKTSKIFACGKDELLAIAPVHSDQKESIIELKQTSDGRMNELQYNNINNNDDNNNDNNNNNKNNKNNNYDDFMGEEYKSDIEEGLSSDDNSDVYVRAVESTYSSHSYCHRDKSSHSMLHQKDDKLVINKEDVRPSRLITSMVRSDKSSRASAAFILGPSSSYQGLRESTLIDPIISMIENENKNENKKVFDENCNVDLPTHDDAIDDLEDMIVTFGGNRACSSAITSSVICGLYIP